MEEKLRGNAFTQTWYADTSKSSDFNDDGKANHPHFARTLQVEPEMSRSESFVNCGDGESELDGPLLSWSAMPTRRCSQWDASEPSQRVRVDQCRYRYPHSTFYFETQDFHLRKSHSFVEMRKSCL
mmetsp:Transcript_13109/g.26590  ORF Transcript_13109/g.26590 Transcript_13109/m.26590 type:complete len:126 (-) Transcript_13109:2573-2950(-)